MHEAEYLAREAVHLRRVFIELESLKLLRGPRHEATTSAGTPGPRPPGNTRIVDACIDTEIELHELCRDVRNTITPGQLLPVDGPALCDWLFAQAPVIVQRLDWVGDLHEAISEMAEHLSMLLDDVEDTPAPEPWQYAPVICQKLYQSGVRDVNPDKLRMWAHRGVISAQKRAGRNTYRMSEVAAYVQALR